MQRALGIDLGTTNSVMGFQSRGNPKIILNRDNRNLTPSIVSRGKRGELLVGVPAKARAVMEPQNTISSIKRFMGRKFADPTVQKVLERVSYKVTEGTDGDVRVWLGDREYTPIEISAIILHRLKEDAENRQSEKFTRAVITVPAYFGERQVAATREAGRMAGFHVLRIINEPTAAALAYGMNREQDEDTKTILVYDLGGGTFDISILMMMQGAITVMGIKGDNLLGGDDFDQDLMEHVLANAKRQHGSDFGIERSDLQVIRQKSEDTKIVLSNQIATDLILPAIGRDKFNLDMEVTREEFEQMIRPRIERTIELTHKAIREASLTPDNIDHILLVGGSTSIPLIEELLKQVFGADKIRKNVDPMESVALGATIQTALIAEIECSICQTRNPMMNDHCNKCSAPLYGKDKVSCPTCYVPCDLGEPNCWKCGAVLTGAAPSPIVGASSPAAGVEQKCPNCGKPYMPGATTCSICDFVLVEQGGLQCPNCGHLNVQGAATCSKCGRDMMASPSDQTAKPLGIALQDGRMSIIIDKGTYFPTHDSIRKEFKTSGPGQRRLEIEVLEGFQEVAGQNEICGIISVPLPAGLRNGSPISIGFGLDESRTITVEVELREAAGDKHVKAQIKRGALDPERARNVREKYERLTKFMDRWSDELTEAERADLQVMLRELEQAMSGDTNAISRPLEPLIARSDQVLSRISEIRASDASVSNFLFATGKYLNDQQQQEVAQWQADLNQARERADWAAGDLLVHQIDDGLEKYSSTLHLIAKYRIGILQNRFSPRLAHRAQAALHHLDEAYDKNDGDAVGRAVEELFSLWDDVRAEIQNLGEPDPGPARPSSL